MYIISQLSKSFKEKEQVAKAVKNLWEVVKPSETLQFTEKSSKNF